MVLRVLKTGVLLGEDAELMRRPIVCALFRRLKRLGWIDHPCADFLERP